MPELASFKLRRFEDIVSTALGYFAGHTTQVTDLTPGSVARSLIEASAYEIERQYVSAYAGLSEAIEEGGYSAFNFPRLEPTAAYGEVTFSRKVLAVPTGVSAVAAAGGSFAANTYYWKVTARNTNGETTGQTATVSLVVTLNQKVTLTWTAVSGATSYRVYRATASNMSGAAYFDVAGGGTTSYVDTGTAGTSQAVPASNTAAVVATDITIPGGTRVGVPGTSKVYAVPTRTTMTTGSYTKLVVVECTQEGLLGNTAANTITELLTANSAIGSVTNASAFTTGTDLETAEQRRQRFSAYIESLHRGTSTSLEEGAKTAVLTDTNGFVVERITRALSYDAGAGLVTLYVHNGTASGTSESNNPKAGNTPDGSANTGLVAWCDKVIKGYTDSTGTKHAGYKPAGVVVTVDAATVVTKNVTVTLTYQSGYSLSLVQAAVTKAIKDYFDAQEISNGTAATFYESALLKAIMRVPGVQSAVITYPAGGTAPAVSGGTITPLLGNVLTYNTITVQ